MRDGRTRQSLVRVHSSFDGSRANLWFAASVDESTWTVSYAYPAERLSKSVGVLESPPVKWNSNVDLVHGSTVTQIVVEGDVGAEPGPDTSVPIGLVVGVCEPRTRVVVGLYMILEVSPSRLRYSRLWKHTMRFQ